MYTIGESVSFIRHDSTIKEIIEGQGKVKAQGLDPENRVVVLVQTTDIDPDTERNQCFNIFLPNINPSDEQKALFRELVVDVQALTDEANEHIKKLTDDANDAIGRLHDDVLGQAVEL